MLVSASGAGGWERSGRSSTRRAYAIPPKSRPSATAQARASSTTRRVRRRPGLFSGRPLCGVRFAFERPLAGGRAPGAVVVRVADADARRLGPEAPVERAERPEADVPDPRPPARLEAPVVVRDAARAGRLRGTGRPRGSFLGSWDGDMRGRILSALCCARCSGAACSKHVPYPRTLCPRASGAGRAGSDTPP